eukprot:3789061-Amphidinium_carterae.1
MLHETYLKVATIFKLCAHWLNTRHGGEEFTCDGFGCVLSQLVHGQTMPLHVLMDRCSLGATSVAAGHLSLLVWALFCGPRVQGPGLDRVSPEIGLDGILLQEGEVLG